MNFPLGDQTSQTTQSQGDSTSQGSDTSQTQGSDTQQQQQSQQQQTQQQQTAEPDGLDVLSQTLGTDDNKDDLKPPTAAEVQAQADALRADIVRNISAITLPQDFLPQDFNPADPAQLQSVLTRTVQIGAQNGVALAMVPMQRAMEAMQRNFQIQLRTALQGQTQAATVEGQITRDVPAYSDSKMKGILQPIMVQMQTQGKSAAEIAKNLNAVAASLGYSATKRAEQAAATGSVALDDLFNS